MNSPVFTTKCLPSTASGAEYSLAALLRRLVAAPGWITVGSSDLWAMGRLVAEGYAQTDPTCGTRCLATGKAYLLAAREAAERRDAKALLPKAPRARRARPWKGPFLTVPAPEEVRAKFQELAERGCPVFIGNPPPDEEAGYSSPELSAWYVKKVLTANKLKE